MKYVQQSAQFFLSFSMVTTISLLSMELDKLVMDKNNPIITVTDDAFIVSAKQTYEKIGAKNFGILQHQVSRLHGLRALNMHNQPALAKYMYRPEFTYADQCGLIEAAKIFSELTNDNSYEKAVRGFLDTQGGRADFQERIAQCRVAGEKHYQCIQRYVYETDVWIDKILAQDNDTVTALLKTHRVHNNVISNDFFLQHFSLITGERTELKPISENLAMLAAHNFDIASLNEQRATDIVQFLENNGMTYRNAKKIPLSDNYILRGEQGRVTIINPSLCTIEFAGKDYYLGNYIANNGTVFVADGVNITALDGQGKTQYTMPSKTTDLDQILCFDNGTIGQVQSNKCIKIYDATMQNCIWKKKTGYYSCVEVIPSSGFMYWHHNSSPQVSVVDANTLSTRVIPLSSPWRATFHDNDTTFGIRMQNSSVEMYDVHGNFKQLIPPLDYSNTKLHGCSNNEVWCETKNMAKHGFSVFSSGASEGGKWITILHLFRASPLKVRNLEEVSFWHDKSCMNQHLLLDTIRTQQKNHSYTFSSCDEEKLFATIPASIQNDLRKSTQFIKCSQVDSPNCSVQ
jgi:hypothetical protein